MKTLDQAIAWVIAAIGVLHASTTWIVYKQFSMSAVWFFDAAVVLWMTAALNLLRIRYATVAPGIRITSIGANLLVLATVVTVALRSKAAQKPAGLAFCLLILMATFFSLRRTPARPAAF